MVTPGNMALIQNPVTLACLWMSYLNKLDWIRGNNVKKIITCLAILALTGSVSAQTLSSDGFYYYQGYSTPYTRTVVPAHYSNGCYVQAAYQYSPAPVQPQVPLPAYTPNWKSDALKYAEARDDYNAYLLTLKQLGITGQVQGYYQLSAINASTQYAYSFQSLASLYNDSNQAALQQAYAQNVQSALALGDKALLGHQSIIALDSTGRARVAEILAKGQTAAQILDALKGPVTQTQTVDQPTIQPQAKSEELLEFQAIVGKNCASCHSGTTLKGGFDISNYLTASIEVKNRVWRRIISTDVKVMMPPTGPRLTSRELRMFAKY